MTKKVFNDKIWGKVIKTFIEGFMASLIVTIPEISNVENFEVIKSILIGAIAMGISAVLNLIQQKLEGKYHGKSNLKH